MGHDEGAAVLLKNIDIRSLAGERAYEKGRRYYERGAVGPLTAKRSHHATLYCGKVSGTSAYTVSAEVDDQDRILRYHCTCLAAQIYEGACKHVAALLKVVQARQGEELDRHAKDEGKTQAARHGDGRLALIALAA